MTAVEFYKDTDGRWYALLPHLDVTKEECEMVCGADTLLEIIAQGEGQVEVVFSEDNFPGSNILSLYELGKSEGGGYYHLMCYEGIDYDLSVWLCDVTTLVMGHIPHKIYFKRY